LTYFFLIRCQGAALSEQVEVRGDGLPGGVGERELFACRIFRKSERIKG